MTVQKKIYTPKRRGQWRIEVEGEENDAHIRAFGIVPKNIRMAVDRKENTGMKNTFANLCFVAGILTE